MMNGLPTPGVPLAETYRQFAELEAAGHSPAYQKICVEVASSPALLQLIEGLPRPKRQPNLLLAAARLHEVPLDVTAMIEHWPVLRETMLVRSTQTNEAGRCAALLPILARLPQRSARNVAKRSPAGRERMSQPLALLEVGASAGLCLYPDRYAYDYNGARLGDSPVVLQCDGPAPAALPQVVWRAGLDLHPLDVSDPDDARWLECLVWPEQTFRRDRLRAAIEVAKQDPPHLVRGNLVTDLDALIEQAPQDATLVVFHTAVLAYVDRPGRERFRARMKTLDGHWISSEAPGVMHDVQADRGLVIALDDTPVATAGPHGQWVRL